jgi:hypothetical protein
MKRILVSVMILCLLFLLSVGAQNVGTGPEVDKMKDTGEKGTVVTPEPAPKPVTRLTVKIIDGMNGKIVELNNCIVQVVGELHICEDSFNYSNSFTEGDKYDIVIWVKLKK